MADDSSESFEEDLNEQEGWEEWSEDEAAATKSLFDSTVLSSVEDALHYDTEHYQFNLRSYCRIIGLVDYDVIKCVNYIRKEVQAGRHPLPLPSSIERGAPWDSQEYLTPVIEDDPLLFALLEDDRADTEDVPDSRHKSAAMPSGQEELVQILVDENNALREALASMRALGLTHDLRDALEESTEDGEEGEGDAAGPSTSSGRIEFVRQKGHAGKVRARGRHGLVDQQYFDSYSHLDIHREMLGDAPRTLAYKRALEGNPSLMKGATVLDVGCGTGILSMFASRGGAAAVIGVDGSEQMASIARSLVQHNQQAGLLSGPVSVLSGKVEELEDIGREKVDVLVSEWMGYALLFESMLDSVLYARDRWLRPGGAILPDMARLYIAGVDRRAVGLNFWDNVYGFIMDPIAQKLREEALKRPLVAIVKPEQVLTNIQQLQEFDLLTMTADLQDFNAHFTLEADQLTSPQCDTRQAEDEARDHGDGDGSADSCCHALAVWFDVDFSQRFCPDQPVVLETSPRAPPTHWAQTLLTLRQPVDLAGSHKKQPVHPARSGDQQDTLGGDKAAAGRNREELVHEDKYATQVVGRRLVLKAACTPGDASASVPIGGDGHREAGGSGGESAPPIEGAGSPSVLSGRISFARGDRHRSLVISLEYQGLGPHGEQVKEVQVFTMEVDA